MARGGRAVAHPNRQLRAMEARRRRVDGEVLEALAPPHREVLNATVLAGRTVNQAADRLGLPVATVKARVYDALQALRVVLEERGVGT